MKKTASRLLIAFMLLTVTGVVAFAKEKSRVITFGQDFVVAETSVKAGTYKITFNDETNELTFADKKTKEVVAKVKASTQALENKSNLLDLKWSNKENKSVLVSITFAGESAAIVIGSKSADVDVTTN